MRKLLVCLGLFAHFAVYCSCAQSLRDRVNKVQDVDQSPEEILHHKRRPTKQKFTEWDSENDLEATDRSLKSSGARRTSTEDLEEAFQSDLKAIRRFAQNVRPIAKNIRRSMNSRRGMGQEITVMMHFIKDTIISLVDAADKYIPHLIPVTKYLRRFVLRAFH